MIVFGFNIYVSFFAKVNIYIFDNEGWSFCSNDEGGEGQRSCFDDGSFLSGGQWRLAPYFMQPLQRSSLLQQLLYIPLVVIVVEVVVVVELVILAIESSKVDNCR